ncbi:hypothetical protein BO94DRAFT_625498 [Aspergillus sclerotioniger CBS 115572]|uniref:DUF7905 domain-containing protein n=1 Tax=Aspergillus sclerotioniger CBS 115572 TaxID=1450535 RepID=A0A317WBC3_9EURO|nr:hypothetical protein BO94DRAFT_625498 [Aspergillus sclerotioniger CBS 115572]PWY83111.1 hypothetical protein BO94DRAFT_625498 [Aspergillus sclerotioniger CBS 115572]
MDFESSGAQEWKLPGYGKRGSTSPRGKFETGASQNHESAPKHLSQNQPLRQPIPTAPATRGTSPSTPGRFRGTTRLLRARGSFRGKIGYSHTASPQPNLFKDSPSKSKWRGGFEPTDLIKLPAPFGTFKNEFFGVARSTDSIRKPPALQGRHEVFKEICRRTGAFIKPPLYTDSVIHLWGESSQVLAAKDIIQSIITKCNYYHKKKLEWSKIRAHMVNKEVGIELMERHDAVCQALRKAPDSFSVFPEQMLFLWPKDGPSINDSLGPELEALDYIRAKFNCYVFVPKDLPDHICALGHDLETMKQIVRCLRTKWTEVVANSNVKAKLYIVEPPTAMKSKIVVKKDTLFAKALLCGTSLIGSEAEKWHNLANLIESKNDARILSAVERCLKSVVAIRGHLRMRVNLGSFVLDEYRVPADDKRAYGFEEFREMLLHEQTKGRLVPGLKIHKDELLARCYKAITLLQPYNNPSMSLESPEPAFSVNFEFMGINNSMLRLEAEFTRSAGATDYEITQRRWLKARQGGQSSDKRPPLQIGVIDFERSDWQLELKSLEFYEASSIDAALRDFSHTIKFQRTANMDDISATPERKVLFSASAPVARFIEKTAIRYQLKGTNCILEIARYDEYCRANLPAAPGVLSTYMGPFAPVPNTSWGASLFDPRWDNLLGEHANLPIGQTVKYHPKTNTFFPSGRPAGGGEKCKGFWGLVRKVKQVAELMGPGRVSGGKKPTTGQGSSSESSPVIGTTDLGGLLNADLGTLF